MRLIIRFFLILILGMTITVVASADAHACAGGEAEATEHVDEGEEADGGCPEKETDGGCQDCTSCACCSLSPTSLLAVGTLLPAHQVLPEHDDVATDYEAVGSSGFAPGIFKPPRT